MFLKIITQWQKQEGYSTYVNGVVIQRAYPFDALVQLPSGEWAVDLDKLGKAPPPSDRLPFVNAR